MTKVRRGGYEFVTWIGDHEPRHVHVMRDGVLIAKWNLERRAASSGHVTGRMRRLIEELVREGRL
jgi:hypothetical protein